MDDSESKRLRVASTVYARAVRLFGADDRRTRDARRELAAAQLNRALRIAREGGLDELDLIAVIQHGELAPEASAA
jgi:hypothetical protein